MDISIIIVNYNVQEFIVPCIKSIIQHSKGEYSYEIIVVDNNSSDTSCKIINEYFPEIEIIKNKFNFGFAKAVNQGFAKSSGEYIFILNPDTLFVENTLSKILKKARSLSLFGAIGPLTEGEDKNILQSTWRFPTIGNTFLSVFHLDFLNFHKNYKDISPGHLEKVDSISGGALFVSSKVFKSLKGFNENLFWMEDIDFCLRLKMIKLDVLFFSKTKILHFSGKSAEKNFKISISNQLLSKIKFFQIHHGNGYGLIIYMFILISSTVKLFALMLLAPFSKKFRKKFYAYFLYLAC